MLKKGSLLVDIQNTGSLPVHVSNPGFGMGFCACNERVNKKQMRVRIFFMEFGLYTNLINVEITRKIFLPDLRDTHEDPQSGFMAISSS